MNGYLKSFLHRGLIFGGLGPIVTAVIFFFIELSGVELMLDGTDILIAVISTYMLAFIQAGASIFNQIEHWSVGRSLLFHYSSLFIAYSLCYLVNSWIAFEPTVILIFCLIFALVYFTVWFTVYFSTKAYTKRLNESLK